MKTLLINGGTGSFGRAMLDRAIKQDWDKIRILSRDEKKQHDLRIKYQNDKIEFYLGDVRDLGSVENAMRDATHVFHAAALKQVPSCEFFPTEAIKTNTLGTYNSIKSAKKFGVKRFVLLSTDKAAYPINAMGMTKALAEKIALSEAFNNGSDKLTINITRYGNVMGSRGSVIPIFFNLLKEKKDLVITDKRMTRFMMSLEQSVELVDFAMQNGKPGELFVQKAESASIMQVAEAVGICLGKTPNTKLIGVRGGEKLNETLVTSEEMSRSEDLGKYFRILPDVNYLGYNKYFETGNPELKISDEFNSDNAPQIDTLSLAHWFQKLGFHENKFYD